MVGLHRRDHVERGEARDVSRRDVLRVLDPEPPVPQTVLPGHPREEVELLADRAVADRMDDHMQACRIRARDRRVTSGIARDEEAAVVRRIGEGLEHRRGVGPE